MLIFEGQVQPNFPENRKRTAMKFEELKIIIHILVFQNVLAGPVKLNEKQFEMIPTNEKYYGGMGSCCCCCQPPNIYPSYFPGYYPYYPYYPRGRRGPVNPNNIPNGGQPPYNPNLPPNQPPLNPNVPPVNGQPPYYPANPNIPPNGVPLTPNVPNPPPTVGQNPDLPNQPPQSIPNEPKNPSNDGGEVQNNASDNPKKDRSVESREKIRKNSRRNSRGFSYVS